MHSSLSIRFFATAESVLTLAVGPLWISERVHAGALTCVVRGACVRGLEFKATCRL